MSCVSISSGDLTHDFGEGVAQKPLIFNLDSSTTLFAYDVSVDYVTLSHGKPKANFIEKFNMMN